jgi:hypothetical protein
VNPRDEDWLRILRRSYAPAPLSPAERVAFDRAVDARRARPRLAWAPALTGAATAAVALGLLLGRPEAPTPVAAPQRAWEYEVLFPAELAETAAADEAWLPDDYQLLAAWVDR